MGAYYAGRCYALSQDAESAYFSSVPLQILSDGTYGYFYRDTAGWRYAVHNPATNNTTVSIPPFISFADCSPVSDVTDGITLGFSIAVVWISVWAIKTIRNALYA